MTKFKLKSKVITSNLLSFFLEFGNAALRDYMWKLQASVNINKWRDDQFDKTGFCYSRN